MIHPSSHNLVLASTSPQRRQLLRQAGIRFRVVPSQYIEGSPQGDPAKFACKAAEAKAYEVSRRLKRAAWVLAADTLVVQGKRIFGKPRSRQDAYRMLKHLSGKEHQVISGVSLYESCGKKISWCEKTIVHMRKISDTEIEDYLNSGEWKGKAGAYGIQGRAGAFVTHIHGCYFNVVGLPLGAVCARLQELGIGKCA